MADRERTEVVTLRLTMAEREAWEAAAGRAGLSLSAYVRRCVKEAIDLERALDRQLAKEVEDTERLHRLDPVDARRRDWGRLDKDG